MAARPTFAESHEAYVRVTASLAEAESPRARVFLICQFLNLVAHAPRLADLYAEQLLAELPSPVTAAEFEGVSPESLLSAADLIEAAGMGLDEDDIGSRRRARVGEVSETLATAAAGAQRFRNGLVVPLAEANPDVPMEWGMRPCRLKTRSLTMTRKSSGDRFQLSGVMLDGKTRFQTRIHKPVLVSRRLLDIGGSVRFAAAIELEAPAPLASGDLASLGLTLLAVDAMSSALMTPQRSRLQQGVSAVGDIQADGRVMPFDDSLLPHVVRCAFYSSAGILVLPHSQREAAEALVRSLKEDWPDGQLAVLGVHRVADALSDNRIFVSTRRSWRSRGWRLLQRYKLWFTAILAVAAGLVSLASFGYGPTTVLRAIAPSLTVAVSHEGGSAVAGSITALADHGDQGFVAAGWMGDQVFLRRYFDADSFKTWQVGQELEERVGAVRIHRLESHRSGLLAIGSVAEGGTPASFVVRLTGDGTLDPGFGKAGIVLLDDSRPEALCATDDGLLVVGARGGRIAAWLLSGEGRMLANFVGPPDSAGQACLQTEGSTLLGGWIQAEQSRAALVISLDESLQLSAGDAAIQRDWSDRAADEVIQLSDESGRIRVLGTSTWYGSVELIVEELDKDNSQDPLRLSLGNAGGAPQVLQDVSGVSVVAVSSLNFHAPTDEPQQSAHDVVTLPVFGFEIGAKQAVLLENDEADDLLKAVVALSDERLVVGGTRVTVGGASPFVEVLPRPRARNE